MLKSTSKLLYFQTKELSRVQKQRKIPINVIKQQKRSVMILKQKINKAKLKVFNRRFYKKTSNINSSGKEPNRLETYYPEGNTRLF
jgi:hypothetical protein